MNEFRQHLTKEDVKWVYNKYLLGHDVWYFRERLGQARYAYTYDDLKLYISDKLELHINNIAIVGSAKLGFSLSPKQNKMFQAFGDNSDVDLVVVSAELFRKSWDAFLDLSGKVYLPNYNMVAGNIFRRFVSLKNPDTRNEFFSEWNRKVEPCKKDLQTLFSIPHDINYRVYESWGAVESYHCSGLIELRKKIEG